MAGPQLNKKVGDSADLMKECEALEESLGALRAAYDQYFMGLDRHLPSQPHKEVRSRLLALRSATYVKSTVVRFRIQSLWTKFSSYERLWQRTLLEIENGTSKRDRFRVRQRVKTAEVPLARPPEEAAAPPSAPPPASSGPAVAPRGTGVAPSIAPLGLAGGKPVPTGPARPAAPAAAAAGLSDDKVRAIFDAYVTAKRRCNEDVSRLSLESVAQSLRKQVPELMKKHNAQAVEFKVVIKDGKAQLRAVPKAGP